MIEFTPFRSVRDIIKDKGIKISVDTLRAEVYKSTIKRYLSKRSFKTKEIKSYSKISTNAKKQLWTKKTTSMQQVITPHFKNIILTTPYKLNQESEYRKCNLVAFGLSQITRPLQAEAKEDLSHMFDKFKVTSFDLAIDMQYPLSTSLLRRLGAINAYQNTIYINRLPNFSYITKIKYYDKAKQLNLPTPSYRAELTIKTSGKLKDIFIPDSEIKKVLEYLGF